LDARNRNLGAWFTRIRTGQVQLPRFQRFEAWGSAEVADLLQTVVDELPAGAVLVLEIGDRPPFHHRPLAGAPEPTERMTELLLDGQQRLTALWRALTEDYPDRTFFVDMSDVDADEDGNRDFRVVPQARWLRKGVRYPLWCDDPGQVLARNFIPLRLLAPEDEHSWSGWLAEATGGDSEKRLELTPLVLGLRARVSQFNLPFLALPVESSEAVVLNVFVKMNTRSVPLTAFDIVVARVEEETEESLHDLVSSLDGQVPGLARYIAPASLVLPAAALLQGKRPTQRELVFLDFRQMIEQWPLIVAGAQLLVEFLEQERIPDGTRLPSEVVLAPLVALWGHAPQAPDKLGAVRTLLRSYLWRSFITSRYEFAAATASFQDFQQILPIVQAGGGATPGADVFQLPLPGTDELRAVGWPRRRDRLARAILACSFLGGARDIADGAEISPANAPHREYHHLFPVAYLAEQGTPEVAASVALNCALITWRTNRTISAKPPVDYLRDRTEAAALGEDQVRERLRSHAIPFEELRDCDFDAFLDRRAQIVVAAFEQLARGADWPLLHAPAASLSG
jgi:hypothetical protein